MRSRSFVSALRTTPLRAEPPAAPKSMSYQKPAQINFTAEPSTRYARTSSILAHHSTVPHYYRFRAPVRRQRRRPLVKDKAFFYFNYEGLRQSLGETFTNFVPNAAFRAQVLAKSPALKPILDAYPLGQKSVDSVTDEVTKVATHTVREDAGMARFDYRFNDTTPPTFGIKSNTRISMIPPNRLEGKT